MTKSTITRERLEEIVSDPMINQGSEFAMMARMALAAMDSEPVAEVLSNRPGNDTSTIDRALPVGTQLYRHAQQSVVPDEIKHRIGGLDWGWEGEFNRGWNACRSAMLQELKKSAGTEAICRSDEIVQELHTNSPVIPDSARDALEKALAAMEFMGDTLNNLDAVCTEDVELVAPAFDAVRSVLAAALQEVKP